MERKRRVTMNNSWQSKFIADYNDKNRPKFNDVFFSKSDDAYILST